MFFKRQPTTRIFYASDIHGSERLFRKFLNAPKVYNVSILIMGGDITGKAIVPCVKSNGNYICRFMEQEFIATTQTDIEEIHRLINYNGLYPRNMEPEEVARLETDPDYKEQLFLETVMETTRCWLEVAEGKLRGSGVTCYLMPGNDDASQLSELISGSNVIINPEERCVELDEYHEMISLGYSNPTPWNTEREISEEQMEEKMEAMVPNVRSMENLVVNFHAPPYNSQLDTAPLIDKDFNIQTQMGQPILVPVGSLAVRSFIEKYQPLVGLHGHIHEASGVASIGRTLCINPGSCYTEGFISGVIVALKKDGLATYQMVRG